MTDSVPYLQNDSAGDFQHSKQCKYKEIYFSKFSEDNKRKQTSLLVKVKSRCFFLFPAARSRSNNSSTEYRTELRLGQRHPYLFIIYNESIS